MEKCTVIALLTAWISLYIVVFFPNGKIDIYNTAIKNCELDIPRTQHCKIIAVVDTEQND